MSHQNQFQYLKTACYAIYQSQPDGIEPEKYFFNNSIFPLNRSGFCHLYPFPQILKRERYHCQLTIAYELHAHQRKQFLKYQVRTAHRLDFTDDSSSLQLLLHPVSDIADAVDGMGVIDLSIIDINHAVQILLTRSLTPQICLQQYAGIFVETFRDFLFQRAASDLPEDFLLSVGFLFVDRPDKLLQILPVLSRQLRVLNPSAYAQQANASDLISCRLSFFRMSPTRSNSGTLYSAVFRIRFRAPSAF